ncbi:MAG: hypothetical protein ACK4UJ_06620 [Leptonema sp. (in: bacteria)]
MNIQWILLFFVFSCLSSQKFEKLLKPEKNFGLLYVLRSFNPTLSLYKVDIQIWKYEKHFKDKKKNLLKEFSLSTGEFVVLVLEEGFYEIFILNNHFSHIFYLEKGNRIFKNITIVSKDFFSIADFFIETIDSEKAVYYFLEGTKMSQKIIQ